jgi:hypothetical protein
MFKTGNSAQPRHCHRVVAFAPASERKAQKNQRA